ncbi:MAG: fimbrial biogenesis chaperone [Gammaproteobacteria bacterium]
MIDTTLEEDRRLKSIALILQLSLLLILPLNVLAGSFGINPVRLELSEQSPNRVLTVRNDGQEASVIQIELTEWTQTGNQENYTATRDLLATPPIFSLPAGASQIVRVGLRRPAEQDRELSYRLFIREVPPPSAGGQHLTVALRISVPVFVASSKPTKPLLQWRATTVKGGGIKISVINAGGTHEHLSALRLYRSGPSEPLLMQQLFVYLLPGTVHEWTFANAIGLEAGTPLHLMADTENGKIPNDIVVYQHQAE